MSSATAAGVTDRLLEIGDIVALVESADAKLAKRRPYEVRSAAAWTQACGDDQGVRTRG